MPLIIDGQHAPEGTNSKALTKNLCKGYDLLNKDKIFLSQMSPKISCLHVSAYTHYSLSLIENDKWWIASFILQFSISWLFDYQSH